MWGDLEERKSAVLERVNRIESKSIRPPENDQASRSTTPQQYSNSETGQSRKMIGSKRKRTHSVQPAEDTENYDSRNGHPPLYSDDELEQLASRKRKIQALISRRHINEQVESLDTQETKENILAEFRRDPQAKNKAFTCCIREYGIGDNADRMLGLFETKISGDIMTDL